MMVGTPASTTPWHKRLECLWQEDDACRAAGDETREMAHQAWPRLFDGAELPKQSDAIEELDLGDCFLYLHPEGRVYGYSFEGEAIYRVKDRADEPAPEPPAAETDDGIDELFDDEEDGDEDDEEAARYDAEHYDGLVLSPDQRVLRDNVLTAIERGERIIVIKGPAGTGKTTAAIALGHELSSRGWFLRFMAPSGKAASRIAEVVKYKATTIHKALFTSVRQTSSGVPIFGDPQILAEGKVAIFIDEGSMVGRRLFSQVVQYMGAQTILIVLGDDKQLPPVADQIGPDFDNPTAELTQIHRQAEDNPIIQVATTVRTGGKLPEGRIGDAYVRQKGDMQLAARWMAREISAGNDAIVLCYSNKTRQKINRLVRHFLGHRRRGDLVVGEHLVVLRNNHYIGKMNGETLVVDSIRPVLPPPGKTDQGVVLVRSGEHAMFLQPDLIGADRAEYEIGKQQATGYTDERLWIQAEYGYALTVHKSQGSEWDKVLFVVDRTMRYMAKIGELEISAAQRLCYTAITRARKQVVVLDV